MKERGIKFEAQPLAGQVWEAGYCDPVHCGSSSGWITEKAKGLANFLVGK